MAQPAAASRGVAAHHLAHRIPRFGSPAFRLFGAVSTKNPVGVVATVFPEFIARGGQERADGGRPGNKRRVGAVRRRGRRHGPARLDGTRPRATVADKVMKSGGRLDKAVVKMPHGSSVPNDGPCGFVLLRRRGRGGKRKKRITSQDGAPDGCRVISSPVRPSIATARSRRVRRTRTAACP